MPYTRVDASEQMDAFADRILRVAIRRRPRGVITFVASPIREFARRDRGGRTATERRFTRAAYYIVFKVPRNYGEPLRWGMDLKWGPLERRGARWGRPVYVRLYTQGSAQTHVRKKVATPWSEDTGFGNWRTGSRRSMPGDRIDSNRRNTG